MHEVQPRRLEGTANVLLEGRHALVDDEADHRVLGRIVARARPRRDVEHLVVVHIVTAARVDLADLFGVVEVEAIADPQILDREHPAGRDLSAAVAPLRCEVSDRQEDRQRGDPPLANPPSPRRLIR